MSFTKRLNLAMKKRDFTQARLAERIGVAQSAVWKLVTGTSKTSRKTVEIAKALNVNSEWLATGIGKSGLDDDVFISNSTNNLSTVKIEVLDIQASCGNGLIIDNQFDNVLRSIEFTEEFATKLFGRRKANDIRVITAKGDSMMPTIKSCANVFVDVSKNYFDGDGVYVFIYDNEIYIKRIQVTGKEFIVISDNSIYEKWRMPKTSLEQIHFQGKVFIGQNIDYMYFD